MHRDSKQKQSHSLRCIRSCLPCPERTLKVKLLARFGFRKRKWVSQQSIRLSKPFPFCCLVYGVVLPSQLLKDLVNKHLVAGIQGMWPTPGMTELPNCRTFKGDIWMPTKVVDPRHWIGGKPFNICSEKEATNKMIPLVQLALSI